jgi:glycine cleavage system regulatory protein
MRDMLVLTIIGADRTGLVEALAAEIAALGGNWEEGRMVRLAGQFAGVLLVTIETARTDELVAALRKLDAKGLQVAVRPTTAATPGSKANHVHVEVTGNDRPGIVRDLSRVLAERGFNVEELESETTSAPMSGDIMFTARIEATAPEGADLAALRTRLESLGGELMVDLTVS